MWGATPLSKVARHSMSNPTTATVAGETGSAAVISAIDSAAAVALADGKIDDGSSAAGTSAIPEEEDVQVEGSLEVAVVVEVVAEVTTGEAIEVVAAVVAGVSVTMAVVAGMSVTAAAVLVVLVPVMGAAVGS